MSSRRPDLLLAAAAAASFSLLRARPCARSGSAPADVPRGARALVAVRPPRGCGRARARARGAGSACPGGAWGAGSREAPAGGAARIRARREPPPPSTHRAPSALAAGRSAERACQHEARGTPTPQWLRAPGTEGAPATPRGLTVASLAQGPANSEHSVGRENCCLLRRRLLLLLLQASQNRRGL